MDLLLAAITIFVASYFQGIAGFGQGLIAAPLVLALFSKPAALSILLVVGAATNIYLILGVKESLDTKQLRLLLIGAVFGLPFGLIFAHSASLSLMQITIGGMSVLLAVLLLFYRGHLPRVRRYSIVAGFASGLLQTGTTLSGPPLVLVLTAQNTPKQDMRKMMPVYFLCLELITSLLFLPLHLINRHGTLLGLILTAPAILGGLLGNNRSMRLNQDKYRLLSMGLVLATGLIAIYSGLRA